MGLLNGKVVAITGAGGGLGRAHALLMANEGAKVVVNDLGGSVDGEGNSTSFADEVVAEIKEAGGEAVANYASVADAEGAQSIVDAAVEAFGKIDVVVNNAGILRDKTLAKMSEEMWDAVIAVHLKGTYLVTQAAFRQMVEQETGGRIINTSSLAGLLGNFGQTNYAAAKAGIAGITRTVALEGRRAGITVNAIAPVAKTRMTDDIDAVPREMEPEDVSPLVAWLASDEAEEVTGRIFGAHGSHYFEYKMQRTPGVDLGDQRWTPAKVGELIDEIGALPSAGGGADAETESEVRAFFEALPKTLKADRAGSWEATIQFDVEGTGSYTIRVADGEARFESGGADDRDGTVTFDSADTLVALASGKLKAEQAFMGGKLGSDNMDILMKFGKLFDLAEAAAAIGPTTAADEAGADDEQPEGLNREMLGAKYKGAARFVKAEEMIAYAGATEDTNPRHVDVERDGGVVAPPLFTQKLFHEVMGEAITDERLNVDMLRLVHGEQDMRFHRPLEPWDLAAARAEVADIEDKSSGQLLTIRQWIVCEGEVVAEARSGLFIRGAGGGGGAKKDKKKAATSGSAAQEEREIVYEESQPVAEDQPHRFAEASGDHNPIHTDPAVAEAAGLPSVILHGMCTMAFAQKAIVDGICEGDSRRLARLKVRFSKPVLPGQTVTTRVWKSDEAAGVTAYGFDAVNDEGQVVLSQGLAEVRESA